MPSPEADTSATSRARPLLRLTSTDEVLVARVRAGDVNAFDELVQRYHRSLLAFVRSRVRHHSPAAAEDIVQDVFIATYRRLFATDRRMEMRSWLHRCALNACIDLSRRPISVPIPDDLSVDSGLSAPGDVGWSTADLAAALRTLPPHHARALLMYVIGGRSYLEIAEDLGVTHSAVKSLLHRARTQLRAQAALELAA